MPPTFVLTNNKGGVGKSTTVVNAAFGLVSVLEQSGASNRRVLIVDTDSQAHATLVTTATKDDDDIPQMREFGRDDSLVAVMRADRKNTAQVLSQMIVQSTWHPDLHVLPASALLDEAERELIGRPGAPYLLQQALKPVADHYAAIVIDTRPSFALLTEMALLAATDAIIPVEPRFLETVGLQAVINKIMDIREGWQYPDLRISGIVITKFDKRISGHNQMVESFQQHPQLGPLVMTVVPQNEAISYSHSENMSIFEYDGQSAAAVAYAELVKKMIGLVQHG